MARDITYEPKVRRGEVPYFQRVQDLLGAQSAMLPVGIDGGVPRDMHLMLFDPVDGCYHAFLSSGAAEVDDEAWDRVYVGARTYVSNAGLSWLSRWIKSNVGHNADRLEALRYIRAAAQGRRVVVADRAQRARLCRIFLSALPSQRHWDVCGFFDATLTASRTWVADPLRAEANRASADHGAQIERGSWSVWHYEEGELRAHLLNPELLSSEDGRLCLDAIGETDALGHIGFPLVYSGRPDFGVARVGGTLYPVYTAFYEPLYQALFPQGRTVTSDGAAAAPSNSEWHTLLAAPLFLWSSFVGIVFVGVGGTGELDRKGFAHWLEEFGTHARATVTTVLQSLALIAFDRRFFARLQKSVTTAGMWDALCECLPSLVRCERCERVEEAEVVSTWEWKWDRYGYRSSFAPADGPLELPGTPRPAALTFSFEPYPISVREISPATQLEIRLARENECSPLEEAAIRLVVELKVDAFSRTIRRALEAEYLRRDRVELLSFIDVFGHEIKNTLDENGWYPLMQSMRASEEVDRDAVIVCLSRMWQIQGLGTGIRSASRISARPHLAAKLREDWLECDDQFRYDDSSLNRFREAVTYLFTIIRKSYPAERVSVHEGRPQLQPVDPERDWTLEPLQPFRLTFPPLKASVIQADSQASMTLAAILAEPLRNAIRAVRDFHENKRVVYWTLDITEDRSSIQVTVWNEMMVKRDENSSGVEIVDLVARRLGIGFVQQPGAGEYLTLVESGERIFKPVVVTINPQRLGRWR